MTSAVAEESSDVENPGCWHTAIGGRDSSGWAVAAVEAGGACNGAGFAGQFPHDSDRANWLDASESRPSEAPAVAFSDSVDWGSFCGIEILSVAAECVDGSVMGATFTVGVWSAVTSKRNVAGSEGSDSGCVDAPWPAGCAGEGVGEGAGTGVGCAGAVCNGLGRTGFGWTGLGWTGCVGVGIGGEIVGTAAGPGIAWGALEAACAAGPCDGNPGVGGAGTSLGDVEVLGNGDGTVLGDVEVLGGTVGGLGGTTDGEGTPLGTLAAGCCSGGSTLLPDGSQGQVRQTVGK